MLRSFFRCKKEKMQNRRRTKSNFGVKRNVGFQSNRKRSGGGQGGSEFRRNRSTRNGSFRRNSGNFGQRNSRRPRGENIDPNRFIQRETSNDAGVKYEAKHTFYDFGFCDALQFNLDKREYETPTPIQDQSIKPIMDGKDLIGLANTGTGKTAAFLLPLIEKVYKDKREKVIIIAPTRELAIQIDNELRAFANQMRIYSQICVGGMPIGRQIQGLRRNPSFVIGTPGRLKDLSDRGLVKFNSFSNIVLDEVDRMLDMGFVNEITAILNVLPQRRQALFFSATIPEKIKVLTSKFLNNPVTVAVKTRDTAANVVQDIIRIRDKSEKFSVLQNLLRQPELSKVLIFTETKREVEKLAVELSRLGHKSESIHGNKRQNQRQKSLAAFRDDRCKILVATDVAARGLDIANVTHVINYTIPMTYNDYIHRIGRTGRGNKSGKALTFVGQ